MVYSPVNILVCIPPDRWGVKQSLCPLFRSFVPFPCDNLSFLGATGLKLHTQVAYVRGRCGIAIEVNGQGQRSWLSVTRFPCNNLRFLGPTGLKLHTQGVYLCEPQLTLSLYLICT
jgi:hypothetical protein